MHNEQPTGLIIFYTSNGSNWLAKSVTQIYALIRNCVILTPTPSFLWDFVKATVGAKTSFLVVLLSFGFRLLSWGQWWIVMGRCLYRYQALEIHGTGVTGTENWPPWYRYRHRPNPINPCPQESNQKQNKKEARLSTNYFITKFQRNFGEGSRSRSFGNERESQISVFASQFHPLEV